jgi:hypothetical protein
MRLADRLGKTKQEVQRGMTSSEFILWKVYLEEEVNYFHREDYFWAQIALEIRRVLAKNPNKYQMKDFLVKFKSSKPEVKKPLTEEEKKQRTWKSMAYWLGLVGGGGKKK